MPTKKKPADDSKPKRKRGGQPGNRNAVGNRGNLHPVKTSGNTKHGAYSLVKLYDLSPEEQELLDNLSMDIDILLIDQIRIYIIREYRILKAIKYYRQKMNGDIESRYVSMTTRTEAFRDFETEEDRLLYEARNRENTRKGKKLPGEPYTITTQEKPIIEIILRLEQELTTVQAHCVKAVASLAKFRAEKAKAEGRNSEADSIVEAWINAVIDSRENRKKISDDTH